MTDLIFLTLFVGIFIWMILHMFAFQNHVFDTFFLKNMQS